MNKNKKIRTQQGFTLIEVLVALAVLSIALTAIIQSSAQHIRTTFYLQQKTLATWVGTHVIHQAQLGLLKLPKAPDSLQQETHLLNQAWSWQAQLKPTPNPRIAEIHVDVYQASNKEKLTTLVSYLYVPPTN